MEQEEKYVKESDFLAQVMAMCSLDWNRKRSLKILAVVSSINSFLILVLFILRLI